MNRKINSLAGLFAATAFAATAVAPLSASPIKAGADKSLTEASCGGEKGKDHKCGKDKDGKCGKDHKCGKDKKKDGKDASCGAGSCGSAKKG